MSLPALSGPIPLARISSKIALATVFATLLLTAPARVAFADPTLATATTTGARHAVPVSIRGRDFEREVLRSKVPVVVEFWATWCGPCRKMEPRLEELASIYGPDLRVVRIDFDASRRLAARLDVERLPTLIVFDQGEEVSRSKRTMTVAELQHEVSSVVLR